MYTKDSHNVDKRYIYRCSKRHSSTCKGILVKENENFILESSHNHPSDPYIIEILNLKNEMTQMCCYVQTPKVFFINWKQREGGGMEGRIQ